MYVSGYEADPQLAGFLSKIGKKLKKIVKPIAHIGAAVATGGASLAVSSAMIQKSAQKKAIAAQQKGIAQATADAMGETQANFDAARYIAENYATANWGKGKTAASNRAKWTADPWGHWNKYGKKLGWAFPYKTAATTLAPVAPVVPVTTVAPTAAAVTQAAAQPAVQPLPMPTHVPTFMQPSQYAPTAPVPAQYEPFETTAEVSQAKLPPWAIPAGLGVLGVALVMMTRKGGRR